jgi:arginase family enzyme
MSKRPQAPPEVDATALAGVPRPGWAGLSTLFGCPAADLLAPPQCDFLVAGVPFDATASSRPGAAEGPEAIRRASRVIASYLDSLGEREMLDTRTGCNLRYARPRLADVGDLHVFPTDAERHRQAVTAEARHLARSGATPVFLGGDHSVTFPLFAGVALALAESRPEAVLGYVQIDHHFDFGDKSPIHGRCYHGSNARRISELPGSEPRRIAFVGAGAVTRQDQFAALQRDGYHILTAAELRRAGPAAAAGELREALAGTGAEFYLSIDIDVLEAAEAPGTGALTLGGLRATELLDLLAILRRLPLAAIDLVELAPRYDPTGRSSLIAAQVLFDLLFRRET